MIARVSILAAVVAAGACSKAPPDPVGLTPPSPWAMEQPGELAALPADDGDPRVRIAYEIKSRRACIGDRQKLRALQAWVRVVTGRP